MFIAPRNPNSRVRYVILYERELVARMVSPIQQFKTSWIVELLEMFRQ